MCGYLVIANPRARSVEGEALDAAVQVLSAAAPTEVHMPADPARLDTALTGLDGRVVAVAAVGPAARVGFAAALRGGTYLDRDDVHHLRASACRSAANRCVTTSTASSTPR